MTILCFFKILRLISRRYSCSSSPDTLACLRAANINTLEYMNNKINYDAFYGTYAFVPVVDGAFIIDRPTVMLAGGKVNGVRDFIAAITPLLTLPFDT